MTDPLGEKPGADVLSDMGHEAKGMLKHGMDHPATKPVLVAAGVGAVAAILLPVVTIPVGLAAGAGYALYRRARR